MDNIIKLQVKSDSPIKQILSIFKSNKSAERAYFLKDDTTAPLNLKNVLCIPYGEIGEDPRIVLDFIIFKLAILYGIKEINNSNSVLYPCYYANNSQTFLLPAEDYEQVIKTESGKPERYGILIKNNKQTMITDKESIELNKLENKENYIVFVEHRNLIIPSYDNPILTEAVKDAKERADFIIFEHVGI